MLTYNAQNLDSLKDNPHNILSKHYAHRKVKIALGIEISVVTIFLTGEGKIKDIRHKIWLTRPIDEFVHAQQTLPIPTL